MSLSPCAKETEGIKKSVRSDRRATTGFGFTAEPDHSDQKKRYPAGGPENIVRAQKIGLPGHDPRDRGLGAQIGEAQAMQACERLIESGTVGGGQIGHARLMESFAAIPDGGDHRGREAASRDAHEVREA